MKIIKITFTVICLFLAPMTYNMMKFGYTFNDGFWRTLMTPFEGTIWAKNYSEKAFNKLTINMTEQEVTSLLGEPLRKDCGDDGECFWLYTRQDTGTADFDQRWVILNKKNRVTEIRKSFYID